MNEQFELPLLQTGVPGLDIVLGGGLPELSFNIIGGAPGSGKTTFAQQIMFALANPERKALFFTAMGEPPIKMLRYQQQFRFFDFDKVDTSVRFVSLAAEVEGGNYDDVLAQICEQVREHAPALVFIDSFRSFVEGAKGPDREVHALQSRPEARHPNDRLASDHLPDRGIPRQRDRPQSHFYGRGWHDMADPERAPQRHGAQAAGAENARAETAPGPAHLPH